MIFIPHTDPPSCVGSRHVMRPSDHTSSACGLRPARMSYSHSLCFEVPTSTCSRQVHVQFVCQ